uniref:Uncharacterized protein n=1 Tax=Tetranychus urticae TaxID=32264 RepID=T1KH10_TETUR
MLLIPAKPAKEANLASYGVNIS